jgi:hypothetical protein
VFGVKYSIIIDIRELEATMSDHRITTIARGMHQPSNAVAQIVTAKGVLEGSSDAPFAAPLLSRCLSCP